MGFVSPHDADDALSPEAAAISTEGSFARYKGVLSSWRLWVASLSIGFQNAARYGLLVWVPVHFLGADWAKADAATSAIDPRWISIALPVGMAVGAFTNGWVSDKFFNSRRSTAIVLYMVLATLTSLYMYTIPTTEVYLGMGVLFLCGFFVYGPQSSFWALCPDLVGHKRAGTATGVMNFCAYLFAGLGEPIIGISWTRAMKPRWCSWWLRSARHRAPRWRPLSGADTACKTKRPRNGCEGALVFFISIHTMRDVLLPQ